MRFPLVEWQCEPLEPSCFHSVLPVFTSILEISWLVCHIERKAKVHISATESFLCVLHCLLIDCDLLVRRAKAWVVKEGSNLPRDVKLDNKYLYDYTNYWRPLSRNCRNAITFVNIPCKMSDSRLSVSPPWALLLWAGNIVFNIFSFRCFTS